MSDSVKTLLTESYRPKPKPKPKPKKKPKAK